MRRLTLAALAAVPLLLFAAAAPAVAADGPVARAELTKTGKGPTRTYFVTLYDSAGAPVVGAVADLGGLSDNPDYRARTVDMEPTATPGEYKATLEFPANGSWVLVMRTHAPAEWVELFYDTVTGADVGTGDHVETQSSKTLLADNPDFYKIYGGTPGQASGVVSGETAAGTSGAAAADAAGHGTVAGAVVGAEHEGFELVPVLLMLAHAVGAAAWLGATIGLAIAARVGPGAGRRQILDWVSRNYGRLCGYGLVTVIVTGIYAMDAASAGLTRPTELMTTGVGTAYLCVFVLKMVFVAASLWQTWRISRVLDPRSAAPTPTPAPVGLGAMAADPREEVLPLANVNVVFAGVILGCVAVLNQLHHLLPH
ncbi:MAG: hypothetical protein K1X95_15250 [Acidimicrobiia bacterium]|nr:hypothetical protein [Acidimicrobiia bacterium]